MHDISKVGVSVVILLKPGRLSAGEFAIMQHHTVIGSDALRSAVEHTPSASFLAMAADIARSHHERLDGSGYPDGLRGRAVPLAARLVALADVYDALTSVRVYKAAFDPLAAKTMIEREAGTHFDPVVIEAFQHRWQDSLDVQAQHADDGAGEAATTVACR